MSRPFSGFVSRVAPRALLVSASLVALFHCGGDDSDGAASTPGAAGAGGSGAAGAAGAAGQATEYDDLSLKLTGMGVHVSNVLEVRVVGDGDNTLRARAVVQPLGAADVAIDVKRFVPRDSSQKYRLDFYADVNGSGGFDGIDSVQTNDHAWRIDGITASSGVVSLSFAHNVAFTDINQFPAGTPAPPKEVGAPLSVKLQGLGALVGKPLELRLVEVDSGRVAIAYRYTAALETTLKASGAVDTTRKYSLDVTADGAAMCLPNLEVTVGGIIATFDPAKATTGACQTGP